MSRRSGWSAGKIVAIILAAILGAGIVLGIVYRKQLAVMWGDFKRYVKRVDDEVPKIEGDNNEGNVVAGDETEEENENMSVEVAEESGIALAVLPLMASDGAASATSSDYGSRLIEATITPENATDKRLNWEISFVLNHVTFDENGVPSTTMNYPTDVWYIEQYNKGLTISDFVTVTPSEDTLSATITCIKDFACPIRLTVTADADEAVKATVNVGFKQRISGAKLLCSNYSDGTFIGEKDFIMSELIDFGGTGPERTFEVIRDDNVNYKIKTEWVSSDYTNAENYSIRVNLGTIGTYMSAYMDYEFIEGFSLTPGAFEYNFNFFYSLLYFLDIDSNSSYTTTEENAALALPKKDGSSYIYFSMEFLQKFNADANTAIEKVKNGLLFSIVIKDPKNITHGGMNFWTANKNLYPVLPEEIALSCDSNIIF